PLFRLDVRGGSINTDSLYRIRSISVLSLNNSNQIQLGDNLTSVGIGTSTPTTTLEVAGSFASSNINTGEIFSSKRITIDDGNGGLTQAPIIRLDPSSGGISVTSPAGSTDISAGFLNVSGDLFCATLTAASLIGDGSGITNIDASQLFNSGGQSGKFLLSNGSGFDLVSLSGDASLSQNGDLQLSPGVVGSLEITDNSVGTADIQSNSVTGTKIALGGDVAGDIMYYNGLDYIRLPAGSNGQVLKIIAGAPFWSTDLSGLTGTGLSTNKLTAWNGSELINSNVSNSATGIAVTGGINTTNDLSIGTIIAGLGSGQQPSNTVFGSSALLSNSSGVNNSMFGNFAGQAVTTGSENTAMGVGSLRLSPNGTGNTAVGFAAGDVFNFATGNTLIGANATANTNGLTNATALGFGATITASNQVRIGNAEVNSIGGIVNWTSLSDGRVKREIKENVPGLDFILQLRPVTYRLDFDNMKSITGTDNMLGRGDKTTYTGFIAQEVESAANNLGFDFSGVDHSKNSGDLYGLRYAEFVTPLVKAVQELAKQNQELLKMVEELKRGHMQSGSIRIETNGMSTEILLGQNIPNPADNST
ncbi:MAG: tail fiber domain-containing protein, partial [Bacteroidota bacterium]